MVTPQNHQNRKPGSNESRRCDVDGSQINRHPLASWRVRDRTSASADSYFESLDADFNSALATAGGRATFGVGLPEPAAVRLHDRVGAESCPQIRRPPGKAFSLLPRTLLAVVSCSFFTLPPPSTT